MELLLVALMLGSFFAGAILTEHGQKKKRKRKK